MLRVISAHAAADSATPVDTVLAAVAVWWTFDAISRVVMLCSYTAAAMVVDAELTRWIASPTSLIERTASPVEA